MKVSLFNSLIYMLIITLLIPGIMPVTVAADDDEPSENDGNSTILLPDLIIESSSWNPSTPKTGEQVTITATVKNQGDADSGPTNLVFYGNGNKIGESPVPKIEAGKSERITFSWRPETESTVEISARVDEENSVTEIDENNNFIIVGSITFESIRLPDLVIDDLSWSPSTPKTGEQVTITAIVKNQGDADSGSTNLVFYGNGNKIGESSVPKIEAGKSERITFLWRPETESTTEISAQVDERDSVEESNEANNGINAGFITFENTRFSDLVIDTLECSANPKPGKFQNIYITVENQGTAASEETDLRLYIDGRFITSWKVTGLPQGEKSYVSYAWVPRSEGSAEIKAVVDEDNLVRESDERNNEKIITVIVAEERLPDLIIEDIVPESAEVEEGKLLNLTLRVKNQGTAPSEEVLAKYYINGTAPAQDDIRIPALSEGTGADVIFSLVPDREGQMEVRVFVDSGTNVYESDENNNQFTKIIDVKTILPDLKIESLSLNPAAPRIGDNITFTVSIKNIGLRNSASSKLKYYINGANVTHSGEVSVPAIASGEITKGIFHWIPEEEGDIEIKLVADAGGVIREDDETNNELTKAISISKQTPGSEQPASGSGGSPGSSSSSSSSMGSGVSKEPARNVEVKELSTRSIISGYHVRYDFPENVTCITYIEFDPVKTFKRTTATVEVLKGKSIFVQKEPPGRIYKQVNIWVGNKGAGLPASIKNGYTGFKVEKAWIKENSVDESNITLLWYDSKWKPLSTEKTGEDENYIYFKTKTPGYSCFAISEYTGEEGTVEESGDQEGIQQTLRSWEDRGKAVLNSSAEKEDGIIKKPMGVAKILLAISLPLFMILVEYFILKKKI